MALKLDKEQLKKALKVAVVALGWALAAAQFLLANLDNLGL